MKREIAKVLCQRCLNSFLETDINKVEYVSLFNDMQYCIFVCNKCIMPDIHKNPIKMKVAKTKKSNNK